LALTPKDSEAFLREVDEELRRDQLQDFLGRYGKLIIAAVVLFLVAVAGYLYWQNHQRAAAEKQAEDFTAILTEVDSGKVRGGDPRIDKLAKDGTSAYRTQALLLKAGLAAQAGRDGEAIGIYRQLAGDKDVARAYRDAALVRQTALEYDKLAPQAVIYRLKPLAVQGNPWFGTTGEMVGLAYIRQHKEQLAAPLYVALAKDKQVPTSVRERASEIALSLGADPGVQDLGDGGDAAKEANQ
jgi:hypothetical protein